MTITGTNFTGATTVDFGASGATFTVNSATSITATSPPGSVGTVDVTVTSLGGTSSTSAADHFTYAAAPTVTAVSPSTGPATGGTGVTITGTGFVIGATTVAFGASAGTDGQLLLDHQLFCHLAGHAAGTIDVTVTTAGGTSATSAADEFTYVAAPTVTGGEPELGPDRRGTSVTVTGTNFAGATAVTFGSRQLDLHGQLGHLHHRNLAGGQCWHRRCDGHHRRRHLGDQRFRPVHLRSRTDRHRGQPLGRSGRRRHVCHHHRDRVRRRGNNSRASALPPEPESTVLPRPVVQPPPRRRVSGTVNLTVTTAGGTSATGSADDFTYEAAPTVTAVSPSAGPVAGGTSVTITGTDLTGATAVTFGSTAATSVHRQLSHFDHRHLSGRACRDRRRHRDHLGCHLGHWLPPTTSPTTPPRPSLRSAPRRSSAGGTSVTITGTGFDRGDGGHLRIDRRLQLHRQLSHLDHGDLAGRERAPSTSTVTTPAALRPRAAPTSSPT